MASIPAAAQSMVAHAETLCEREDHLWDVVGELSIPVDLLSDDRQQSKVTFQTEEMTRAFLYQHVRGFSENELADQLSKRTVLCHRFGFEIDDLSKAPRQQTINAIWKQFEKSQTAIEATATGIRPLAVEHDVIAESLVPTEPQPETLDDDGTPTQEYKKEKATKTIRLARKHVLPEFDTKRAPHRDYSDEELLDMFARICATKGSAHSESEYGWLTEDDVTCDDSTFLRALKKIATPEEMDAQLTLSDFGDDEMPTVDLIRDEVMKAFDGATENVLSSLRGQDLFDQNRRTVAAIDITYEQIHVWPWEDKAEGIPNPDFPVMASGYKKDNEYKRGYKYATITLVGDHAPIILGIEPVKENSKWEPDDAPSYSKAELVERLLDKAQRFVDLDEVLLDRGFYSNAVYAAIHDRGITYTSPVPKYQDDYSIIEDIEEHPTAEAAVNHDVPFGYGGEVHHTAEFLYVPTESDDADGKYAVFVTNRNRVEPEEIEQVCNRYRRRWDIENQYKSIKSFLPKTSSMDYRIRFVKFALAALIYNLWRLTDYLIKAAIDRDVRSPPVITAKTFVRALGDFLRDIG